MAATFLVSGEYHRFRAVTDVVVQDHSITLKEGTIVEFDGKLMKLGSSTYHAPTLRHAINVGWLVLEGDDASLPVRKTPGERAKKIASALRNHPQLLVEVLDVFGFAMTCEVPGCLRTDTGLTPSMTAYEWDGQGEDPNRDLWLCPDHADEHTEQMEAQWAEYRAGLL